ncbi:MAG: sel1 repeat family protein [Alphaproteobacteria bacterium]|nr:sel1 repeat family protein [Alphaproteobacteria bacterium]
MGQLLMQDCTGMQDMAAGVAWLTKAVTSGNIVAEVLLGRAYMRGLGVTQDDIKAFALYSQAAAAANPIAQMELGYMYNSGRGVTQDRYQGLQWSVKAAEQGNAIALSNVGWAYIKGEVLARNVDRAAYFSALAEQRADLAERAEILPTTQQVKQATSVENLDRQAKRAKSWSPGPGSLEDVLSEAEDFRRSHR